MDAVERPYSALLVSALRAGLSYQDLRHMSYRRLMWTLDSYRRLNEPQAAPQAGERLATQDDIDTMLH